MLFFLFAAAAVQAAPVTPAAQPRHYGRLFISPMGEPFRGADPIADWFNQADRNHDGFLTVDEMQRDADRFFLTLDTDHDGEIGPDEITHYETEIAPQVRGEPEDLYAKNIAGGDDQGADGEGYEDDSGYIGNGTGAPQGAGSFGLLNIPEPVSAADLDLNRGVSREEFHKAAGQRFVLLDTNHAGKLTLAQLEGLHPSGSVAGFHHHGDHHRPSGK